MVELRPKNPFLFNNWDRMKMETMDNEISTFKEPLQAIIFRRFLEGA